MKKRCNTQLQTECLKISYDIVKQTKNFTVNDIGRFYKGLLKAIQK
jgi:hypothetical protein